MRVILLAGLVLCSRLLAAADVASLANELRRLQAQLDAGERATVLRELPAAWFADTSNGPVAISTAPLRSLLERQPEDRRDAANDAKLWLNSIAAHLDGFAKAPRAQGDARTRLDRILARREFAGIGPPSAWEQFRERLAQWIAGVLRRIFSIVGDDPTTGAILLWSLLTAAVAALGFLLVRLWMRGEPAESTTSGGPWVRARTSDDWVRSARGAAEREDWRRAILCSYWAGIARLEETGKLTADRARTPRECLRAIIQSPAGASPSFIQPVEALTMRLERFWYARMAPGATDFAACLDSLEALGCQVN